MKDFNWIIKTRAYPENKKGWNDDIHVILLHSQHWRYLDLDISRNKTYLSFDSTAFGKKFLIRHYCSDKILRLSNKNERTIEFMKAIYVLFVELKLKKYTKLANRALVNSVFPYLNID
jgi:uncharacterized NAD(P)/FAD-binding protein YdhS